MQDVTVTHYPDAAPLFGTGVEMATPSLKIIVARSGAFTVTGRERTAFVVGPRTAPVAVGYGPATDCHEWSLPPWISSALLDVPGGELSGRIHDLSDLPSSPFLRSLIEGRPESRTLVGEALADRSAGRRSSDGALAKAVWVVLQRSPDRTVAAVAELLGVGTRRLQQAARRELGLSPKEIARLLRHQQALEMIASRPTSLAQIAQDAGYADQSHMTREFAAFGAITPGDLRRVYRSGRRARVPT
ncbi:helix-turn-helix transcriptional regulator [Algihabitans albus]|uniref:helix-turn-helix transcriptional regulator n=1 Tax=Algihabitans albus TaxID=2164067 RepID=UPI0035CEA2E8